MERIKKLIIMAIIFLILQLTIAISTNNAFFIEDTVTLIQNVDAYVKAQAGSEIPTLDGIQKHYYNQLTTELAKRVYNALAATTSDSVTIDIEDLNIKTSGTNVDLQSWFQTNYLKYVNDGTEAYSEDSGNYWWQTRMNGWNLQGKNSGNDILLTKLTLTAHPNSNYSQNQNFNNKLSQACNSITGNTVYEKVCAINKYICDNVEYGKKDNSIMYQTAYGALIEGKTVCEGYAQLFNLMCRKKGIISICVYGTAVNADGSTELHGWNYVYEPNKKQWYAVDCTWNDNINDIYELDLNFFMMIGSNTIISPFKDLGNFSNYHIVGGYKAYNNQTYTPTVKVSLAEEKYLDFEPSVQYSKLQNGNIEAKINSNIDLYSIPSGWNISTNRRTITKTYDTNKTETVTIGNMYNETKSINIEVKLDNIDENPPVLTVAYSTTAKTNKDVIATITANEEIQSVNGWTLSNDKKKLTKTYSSNTQETVTVKDLAGNSATKTIEINNIDKIPPEIQVIKTLSNDKKSCEIEIKGVNEIIQGIDEWEGAFSKIYTQNMTEEVTAKDLAGNETKIRIEITEIQNEEIFISDTYIIGNDTIKNIQPNMTITEFAQNIRSNQEYIIREGANTISGEDKIKTGQTLTVGNKTYALVVTGDVNGDGQANIQDILSVNKHRLNKVQLTNEYFQAGDVNNDEKVDLKDILQINKYRLGKVSNL